MGTSDFAFQCKCPNGDVYCQDKKYNPSYFYTMNSHAVTSSTLSPWAVGAPAGLLLALRL